MQTYSNEVLLGLILREDHHLSRTLLKESLLVLVKQVLPKMLCQGELGHIKMGKTEWIVEPSFNGRSKI